MKPKQLTVRDQSQRNRERFFELLKEQTLDTALSAEDVFDLSEERCRYSYAELDEALRDDSIDLAGILSSCLGKSVASVCFLPVAGYIENHVHTFRSAFNEVVLCDNKKTGREFAGLTVLSQEELDQSSVKCDAFVNTTSSRELAALFRSSVPTSCEISFDQFATEILKAKGQSNQTDRIDSLLRHIEAAEKPLVVLCGIYLSTYTPTLRALAENGFQLFIVARSSTAWLHAGHLAKLGDTLGFALVETVDFDGMLSFLDQQVHVPIFIPGAEETFIGCAFDCSRSAAAASFVAALECFAKAPIFLGLYDIVKPVTKQLGYEADLVHALKSMLDGASAISVGANSKSAGQQLVNALDIDTPISSFYRFGVYIDDLADRSPDGIHIAIVSGALVCSSDNPFLPDLDYFRDLINQSIHLHVYSSTVTPHEFQSSLSTQQRFFFHIHESVSNPNELTKQLSRYHAGIILNDTSRLIEMVAGYKERILREIAFHFLTTMTPSAAMLFGCAGLPIILNRTMSSLIREFPSEYFIPVELSEFRNLGRRLRAIDWDHRHRVTRENRRKFSIQTNLSRFIDTINSLDLARGTSSPLPL